MAFGHLWMVPFVLLIRTSTSNIEKKCHVTAVQCTSQWEYYIIHPLDCANSFSSVANSCSLMNDHKNFLDSTVFKADKSYLTENCELQKILKDLLAGDLNPAYFNLRINNNSLNKYLAINNFNTTILSLAITINNTYSVTKLLTAMADPYLSDCEGNTALHNAVLMNNIYIVMSIIEKNVVGLDMQNIKNETALHLSALQNNTDIFMFLLKNDADPYIPDLESKTTLHVSTLLRNRNILNSILSKSTTGVNLQTCGGFSALSLALFHNEKDICALLLRFGASPYIRNNDGRTALHDAVIKRSYEIVQLFLNSSNEGIDYKDGDNYTALFIATKNNDTKICRLLLETGAHPFVRNNDNVTVLHEVVLHGNIEITELILSRTISGINFQDKDGSTALHLASRERRTAILGVLLKASANPCITDKQQNLPLHLSSQIGDLDSMVLIIKNVQGIIDRKNEEGNTSLILASFYNHSNVVEYLLESGAKINELNIYGWTALFASTYRGYFSIIDLLLKENKRIANFQNDYGETALHIASIYNNTEMVWFLITRGAHSLSDIRGSIPLHYSAQMGNVACIRMWLMIDRSSIGMQNNRGDTALHVAASHVQFEAVEYLLKSGADTTVTNYFRSTPLHTAIKKKNTLVTSKILNCSSLSVMNAEDGYGRTPLLLAAWYKQIKVVELLLLKGADPYLSTTRYQNVIHNSAYYGNLDTLKLIMDKFPYDVNFEYESEPPLFAALSNCKVNAKVIDFLLLNGANVLIKSLFGENIIHIAARSCNLMIFQKICNLIRKNLTESNFLMYIKKKNELGQTPLFIAAAKGNEDVFFFIRRIGGIEVEYETNGCSLLTSAAKGGNIKIIEHILSNTKITVNKACTDGFTPLMAAVYSQRPEASMYLLSKGANFDDSTAYGNTVLHYLAGFKNISLVRDTLQKIKIFDVNVRNVEGYSPLMFAVQRGEMDALSFLLVNNADPLMTNIYGDNSISLAAREGSLKVLESLEYSKYRIDPDSLLGIALSRREIKNKDMLRELLEKSSIAKDPLFFASANGDIMELEMKLPKRMNHLYKRIPAVMKEFLKEYYTTLTDLIVEDDFETTYESRLSLLDIALMFFGSLHSIRKITLMQRVDCSSLNYRNTMWTTLDFAIYSQNSQRWSNNGHHILNYMFDLCKRTLHQVTNKYGWTLAHKTAWMGNTYALQILEKRGLDLNAGDEFGRTPLHIAVLKGDRHMVCQILYFTQKTIDARDKYGFTALHLAQIYQYSGFFKRLSTATVTMPSAEKFKFIQSYNYFSKEEGKRRYRGATRALVNFKADLNVQDKAFGWTPLHWAAATGDIFSVAFLVSHGAKVNLPSWINQTPMSVARMWGRKSVYDYLKSKNGVW